MLTITVRLLHGTIRAGTPDDTVLTGAAPEAEWPPSPARLFSAFVAADGTRDRCQVTTGAELLFLERAPAPEIYASTHAAETVLVDRYVVKDESASSVVQDYPARAATRIHPGVRLSPREPVVTYVWHLDPDEALVDGLRARAARIGYLGCADSPVQVKVAVTEGSSEIPGGRWTPSENHGTPLPVPYDGFTAALDEAYDAWSAGQAMRRSWIPSVRRRYSLAGSVEAEPAPTTYWLRFDRPVIARRARLVAETLRAATNDRIARLVGDDAVPWQVHGHHVPEDTQRPYQLIRYLPLPDIGYRHSDGAVRGAAVWLPPASSPELHELIRAALHGMTRLRRPGWFDTTLRIHGGEPRPWTTHPDRWQRPSTRFTSALPVVHEHGTKKPPELVEIARWFRNAGHPEPVAATVSLVPAVPGAAWLRPSEVHGTGKTRHPYSWLTVTFDTPVTGPLCVGRARSFGLGLLAPVGDG